MAAVINPSIPNLYAQCRSLGHEWRHLGPVTDEDTRRPFGAREGMIGLRSECTDCTTERVKWITRSGEVVTRYTYPDGYSMHGEERLSSQQWRTQFVTTLFEGVIEAAAQPRRTRRRRQTAA